MHVSICAFLADSDGPKMRYGQVHIYIFFITTTMIYGLHSTHLNTLRRAAVQLLAHNQSNGVVDRTEDLETAETEGLISKEHIPF